MALSKLDPVCKDYIWGGDFEIEGALEGLFIRI